MASAADFEPDELRADPTYGGFAVSRPSCVTRQPTRPKRATCRATYREH